jgi:predicted NACHT family NTPase
LRKWDAKRNIERSQLYKLSVQQKQDLLSQIARITFEQGEYLFRKQEIKRYIIDYICNLPKVSSDLETLQLNSEIILKSLEADHGVLVERAKGIYSFSHRTIQKHFIAKEIINSHNPQKLEIALAKVARCVTQKQWQEVFLLTAYMLQNTDYLMQLAKQEVDNLIREDNYLQKFLSWLEQKSHTVNVTYKLVAVRAFYLDVSLGLDFRLNSDVSLALKLDPSIGIDLEHLEFEQELNFALSLIRELHYNLARSLGLSLDCNLQRSLQHLKEQLPEIDQDHESFKAWWEDKGKAWIEQLKNVQIKYLDISQNWQFDTQQRRVLQQYHDANNLLIDCLKGSFYISRAVREHIEETLFLPAISNYSCNK